MLRLLSLAHLTLADTAPPDLVSAAAQAGFDAVGIRLGRGSLPTDPLWEMLGDTPMRRATRRRLDDTGLRVLEVEGVSIVADRPLAAFKQFGLLLDSATALGAQYLTVASFDPDQTRTAEQLAEICAACTPYNIQPVVEFMARSTVPSLVHAAQLVARPGCERAGIVVDTLHFFRSGGCVAQLAAVDPAQISVLQLSDALLAAPTDEQARRSESRNRLLPGNGELPLAELIAALDDRVPISLEAPSTRPDDYAAGEVAESAMAALRRVIH